MTNAKQIYLVQSLPFEEWVTIAYFDNFLDADSYCDNKIEAANHNPLLVGNYRVYAVADTVEHRKRFGIIDSVSWQYDAPINPYFLGAQRPQAGQDY